MQLKQLKTFVVWKQMVQKFCMGFKELNDQTRSGRPKNHRFQGYVLQAIEINPASSIPRMSGKLIISQCSVVHDPHNLGKSIKKLPNYASCYQNIAKLLTCPSTRAQLAWATEYNQPHLCRQVRPLLNKCPKLTQNYLIVELQFCWLVGWVYGISTIVGYLTPNPFLWK